MNPFDELCNEEIFVRHRSGNVSGPLKAVLNHDKGQPKFTVFEENLNVAIGDEIDRPLGNGRAERYDVKDVRYTRKFHEIPAHFDIQAQRHGAPVLFEKTKIMNVTINNSQGFQIGNHNTQQIIDSFKELVSSIDKGDGTPEQKAEAKSRLRNFFEHPLTAAVVGAALPTLLALL